MRLIDADALIEDLQYDVELDARALDSGDFVSDREVTQFDKDCKQNCIDLLRNAPTVDKMNICKNCRWARLAAGFVTHGRWIGKPIAGYSTVRCSECGSVLLENDGKFPYCPYCGTKMDEVEE